MNKLTKEEIISLINVNEAKFNQAEVAYNLKRQDYFRALKNIRENCPHEDVEYYPDPSGNNDSSYMCKTCGLDCSRLSGFKTSEY